MLTGRENLLETLKKDGKPDRYVNGYNFLNILVPDLYYMGDYPIKPGDEGYDQFGVFWTQPEGQLGAYPVHNDELTVLQDICEWRDIVKKPYIPEDPGYWGMLKGIAAQTDKDNQFVCAFQTQGIFERLHALMGMEDAMCNFYEEPEEMHDLIDFLVEIELDFAKAMVENVGIEAVLHHDDWGSSMSTFMSPDMFEEFIVPAYKKIYGFYHENNVLVIHHNDGYAKTLVPYMIEMGIDIWQGVLPTNDMPELIEKYGGQITFMGEIETRLLDTPNWTPELVKEEVERACRKNGTRNFIPCITGGMPFMVFGAAETVAKEIDRMSEIMFS